MQLLTRKTFLSGLLAGMVLIVSIGTASWFLQPVNPSATTPQLLNVEPGTGVGGIAETLRDRGVIRSASAFRLLARIQGSDIKSGLYHVSPSQSLAAILSLLRQGKASEISVTFPEGLRREEMAELLVDAKLIPSVDDFTRAAVVSDATPDWLLTEFGRKTGDSLEGFLFPDTYRFAAQNLVTDTPGVYSSTSDTPGVSVTTSQPIIDKMLANFRKRTEELKLTYDQLTLASIVEREALFDEDRAPIAGVYVNRLRLGMKLDADPTVQYVKTNAKRLVGGAPGDTCEVVAAATSSQVKEGAEEGADCEWWPALTVRDYDLVDSPFNTYRHPGLPPTPIANPGLASLKAAVHPATHDFLYFLHDRDGHTHFARDAAEHSRNKTEFLK